MHWLLRLPARTIAATALSGLVAAVMIAASPAAASADTTLTVRYLVSGSTFIKAANGTVSLGPGARDLPVTCADLVK